MKRKKAAWWKMEDNLGNRHFFVLLVLLLSVQLEGINSGKPVSLLTLHIKRVEIFRGNLPCPISKIMIVTFCTKLSPQISLSALSFLVNA